MQSYKEAACALHGNRGEAGLIGEEVLSQFLIGQFSWQRGLHSLTVWLVQKQGPQWSEWSQSDWSVKMQTRIQLHNSDWTGTDSWNKILGALLEGLVDSDGRSTVQLFPEAPSVGETPG